MRNIILTSVVLSAVSAGTAFADSPTLTLTNFIGTIEITDGAKLSVTGEADGTADKSGDNLTIDGGETIKSVNCRGSYGSFRISINDKSWFGSSGGYKDLDEYPFLKITAPEDVHLVINNSVVFGKAGDIGSADLKLRSCGELTVGDIAGDLELDVSGSADFTAGDAGAVDIDVSGSGDVTLENVKSAIVTISGSGDVELEDIAGPLSLESRGSGDTTVENIKGDLVYEGRGSSDLSIESVSGRIAISVRGSSDVTIDDGNVPEIFASASGSSDVEFDGTAQSAKLTASGSSYIHVNDVIGERDVSRSGSSRIRIGGKTYD